MLALVFSVASACFGDSATNPSPLLQERPIFDDASEPFVAAQPPTDSERDRLEALALYSAGRMHEQREDYRDALRCYERAFRCDPQAAAVAWSIVRTAVRLKRYSEAVRYVTKAAALKGADPAVLRRLGVSLTEEGDWAGAVMLYEKALAARGDGKELASDILLRMEMGRLYHLTEKPKEAAECFARVLYAVEHPDEFSLEPSLVKILLGEPGPTYQLMGECFLTAGRPQEAQTAFEKAEIVSPDPSLCSYNRARVYAKNGKPAEALAALDAALAAHLGNEGLAPYELLAELLSGLGKESEIVPRLEKLLADEPNNVPLRYCLAERYRAAGNLDKAESLHRELLKTHPMPAGYQALVQIYRQSKRFDALLAVLGEALEKTTVLDLLGTESQTISGDAEAMQGLVAAARNLLQSGPDRATYGMCLSIALLSLEAKQYEVAGEFFERAAALADASPVESPAKDAAASPAPSESLATDVRPGVVAAAPAKAAEVYMAWGVGLLLGDRAAESAKVFQRAIDARVLPDDNPAFHFYLAGALVVAGRTDEALAAARIAAEKKPHSARHRGREAWVLCYAKRYDEGRDAYQRLLQEFDADDMSPDTRTVLREARLMLSNICVARGEFSQAEEWIEQVLDEFPDDEGAMNDLGYLWADQNKNLRRARQMLEKAVEADPENLAYRDSLGWVLFRLGDTAAAVAELEKAAGGAKPDGVVLDHLGDVLWEANQRDRAIESWRKAIGALRESGEAKKAEMIEKKTQNH